MAEAPILLDYLKSEYYRDSLFLFRHDQVLWFEDYDSLHHDKDEEECIYQIYLDESGAKMIFNIFYRVHEELNHLFLNYFDADLRESDIYPLDDEQFFMMMEYVVMESINYAIIQSVARHTASLNVEACKYFYRQEPGHQIEDDYPPQLDEQDVAIIEDDHFIQADEQDTASVVDMAEKFLDYFDSLVVYNQRYLTEEMKQEIQEHMEDYFIQMLSYNEFDTLIKQFISLRDIYFALIDVSSKIDLDERIFWLYNPISNLEISKNFYFLRFHATTWLNKEKTDRYVPTIRHRHLGKGHRRPHRARVTSTSVL